MDPPEQALVEVGAVALAAGWLFVGASKAIQGAGCRLTPSAGGASIVEMQTAGRWQSPAMPGHYARGQLAARGVVARVRYGRG